MPIKTVAFPLLSGGALLLGYAAVNWLRPKPQLIPRREDVQPLLDRLEHVPEEEALDLTDDPPLYEHVPLPPSARGALFLGRAIGALSPFDVHAARALGR